MAGEPGHEELEQRGKRSENAQKGDKEVNVGYAGSDSGFTIKPKSGDRLAIIVFSVAVVILVVSSFFVIKNVKTFFEKPATSDLERVINTKKEEIKERFKEKVRTLTKQPQDSKPKQQVSRKQPMTTKLRLPRSATNAELAELVQKKGHIKILQMSVCLQITDISPLSKLTHLEQLNMEGCKNLNSLGLNGSQGVSDLTPISELTNLTRLSLANLKELRDLSPLADLKGLKHLDLVNSTNITKQQINWIRRALPNCRIIDPYHYHWRRSG